MMKVKSTSFFIICLSLLICLIGILPVSADQPSPSPSSAVNEAQAFIDGIVDWQYRQSNTHSLQDWADTSLSENAGISSEWYIIALSQYAQIDFSTYEDALLAYLDENEIYSASTRLKYALALLAVGSEDALIGELFEQSVGQQGIMSHVYGLHLMNNGLTSETHSAEATVNTLLSLQLDDGGWALTGKVSDVDVTAMTLQALAPHYDDDAVKEAVCRALALLSERQLTEGGYASYGIPNPESVSQVMIALSALGIDCASDSRFIKDGRTLFDALASYRLSDGSFCHIKGGEYSRSATEQVFCASAAYLRMASGLSPLYSFDSELIVSPEPPFPEGEEPPSVTQPITVAPTPTPAPPVTTAPSAESTASANTSSAQPSSSPFNYKLWGSAAVIGLGGIVCLLLFLLKKRNVKNFIAVGLAAAIAIAFLAMTDIRTADDYYNHEEIPKTDAVGSVTLTIRCDTVVGKSDSEYIPQDGIILPITSFEIEKGDTVYDILTEAARKYSIQLENDGNSELAYISGIGYLYAFDELSGWIYRVNGESPSVGCAEYTLSDGDAIEWHYTCELGNDIH